MLVRKADREGDVVRDGVRVRWQQFGQGPRALLLLPTWSIVHVDFWRHQVPYFADRYSVLTFDGRGNGSSDRPTDAAAYADTEFAADALGVLDASGIARAAVLSVSAGALWGLRLAAEHASRVSASVFIAPALPLTPSLPSRAASLAKFDEELATNDGWFKFNRFYWKRDFRGFLEFFFANCFTEPDSEEQIAHFVAMGLETDPETLLRTVEAPSLNSADVVRLTEQVRTPTLVIQGESDAITPPERGRELARLIRAQLVMLPGAGHEPQCRDPEHVNAILDDFLGRAWPATAAARE